jgi:hypothetical protein
MASRYAKLAKGWIALGQDSLLTIESEPDEKSPEQAKRVLFVFYDSVDWSSALAVHWVEVSLAYERKWLEGALGRAGYRLTGGRLPSPEALRGNFFMQGKRIGCAEEGGVVWQFPDVLQQDYSELGPRIRKRAEAALDGLAPCGCPLCQYHVARSARGSA